jgi:hypothetical protein
MSARASLVSAIAAWACWASASCGSAPLRARGSGHRVRAEPLDVAWASARLREATVRVHRVLASRGADGHLSLRLRPDELGQYLSASGLERVRGAQRGTSSIEGEPRWAHLRSLATSPMVGFCARGVRMAEPGGPEGLQTRSLYVDRLLLIGAERDGLWASWIEGLLLTERGWRLDPIVTFAQQVEDPRRGHADVQFWDCDIGQAPLQDRALEQTAPGP